MNENELAQKLFDYCGVKYSTDIMNNIMIKEFNMTLKEIEEFNKKYAFIENELKEFKSQYEKR